jgi:hypothetical protein
MQVPSVPLPIPTNALPQDVVTKVVTNVQAAAPITQNAVNPVPKTERAVKARDDEERSRREQKGKEKRGEEKPKEGDRGASVNISV